MNCRNAVGTDFHAIEALLKACNLPAGDFGEHIENFLVVEENEKIIGVGGLEICGAFGLVRSVAVTPERRGEGIAERIYGLLEDRAVH